MEMRKGEGAKRRYLTSGYLYTVFGIHQSIHMWDKPMNVTITSKFQPRGKGRLVPLLVPLVRLNTDLHGPTSCCVDPYHSLSPRRNLHLRLGATGSLHCDGAGAQSQQGKGTR